jgi:methylmalonyl-CoA carboxyltransferase 12S subunit
MKSDTVNSDNVVDSLEALLQELTRLGERIAALEVAAGVKPRAAAPPAAAPAAPPAAAPTAPPAAAPAAPPAAAPAAPSAAQAEVLSEELVSVIAAAIAAFLGKKPHIRQIRLLESVDWAQQGRVTIQASHALTVHHGTARRQL